MRAGPQGRGAPQSGISERHPLRIALCAVRRARKRAVHGRADLSRPVLRAAQAASLQFRERHRVRPGRVERKEMKALDCIRRFVDRATESRTHPNTIRLFRRVIYGWYFLSAALLLPAAGEFWGPGSLIPRNPWPELSVLNLLDHPSVRPYYTLFAGVHLALLVLGMTCRWPRVTALLIYFTAMNLNN